MSLSLDLELPIDVDLKGLGGELSRAQDTGGGEVLGEQLPTYPAYLTIDGFDFAILPNTDRMPWNATYATVAQIARFGGDVGQVGEWLRLEARTGDNNGAETGLLRVGPDGYPTTLLRNFTGSLDVYPEQNWSPAADDWWGPFEIHAKKDPVFPSEYEGAGPLAVLIQQSGGVPVIRTHVKYAGAAALTGSGDITVTQYTTTLSSLGFEQGDILKFDYDIRKSSGTNTDGYVKIWVGVNGGAKTLIVNYTGRFGYGENRDLYVQYRLYSSERDGPLVAYMRPFNLAHDALLWTPAELGEKVVYTGGDPAGLNASDDTIMVAMPIQITDTAAARDLLISVGGSGGFNYLVSAAEQPQVNRYTAAVHSIGNAVTIPTGRPVFVDFLNVKNAAVKALYGVDGGYSLADRFQNTSFTAARTLALGAASSLIIGDIIILTGLSADGAVTQDDRDRLAAWWHWQNGTPQYIDAANPYATFAPVLPVS